MDEVLSSVSGGLDLDDVARGLWEAALPHLTAAVEGEDKELLTAVEDVARGAGLAHVVSVAALLDGYLDGCRQLCARLQSAGTPEAQAAARRLVGLENVALTRIATGYCSGLEETMVMMRRSADEASRTDLVTGAMKPPEIAELLSLEVERCQRMDVSLGLIEMAVQPPAEVDEAQRAAGQAALRTVGVCLQGCLRRYDSIGMTPAGDFLLVLPDVSRRGLAGAAERLRREVGVSVQGQAPVQPVLILSHYDYVDTSAAEMLKVLEQSLDEARSVGQSLAWS